MMKVKLLAYTPDPEKVIAAAARCCYSNDDPDKLLDGLTDEKAGKFLRKLMESGHFSALEHASFTFSISGVSRSFLAQVTRHRLASFSVRSQRYCSMSDAGNIEPSAIKGDPVTHEHFHDAMDAARSYYQHILSHGIKKEDARFVLPEATSTSMVVTMNARELLHFFSLRCCTRAQWEIRDAANEMVRLVKEVAPVLFAKAGASCRQFGYCPESKMSCGNAPTLEHLLDAYRERTGCR